MPQGSCVGVVHKLIVTGLLLVSFAHGGAAQQLPGPLSIATGVAAGVDELRQWDAFIDGRVREGTLVLVARRDDRTLPDRVHESLAQYFNGVLVHGADITRQLHRGVTVSILGTYHKGIDLDTTPGLSATDVALRLEQDVGATPLVDQPPVLIVLPRPGGSYALAYRARMTNARTYFVDAVNGRIVFEVNEVRTQSAVGTGIGVLGDQPKVSARQTSTAFQAHDQLRPAEILTLDLRNNPQRLEDLVFTPGPPGLARYTQSDVASDGDNVWNDAGVVDAHVHTGLAYDYFAQQQAYDGLDDNNTRIVGHVNIDMINAFFIPPPFGPEGSGALAFGRTPAGDALVAEDVVVHEVMHGVTFQAVSQRTGSEFGLLNILDGVFGPSSFQFGGTTFTCGSTVGVSQDGRVLPVLCINGRFVLLANHGGALNEGYSDIFATAAEFFLHEPGTGPNRADYQIGEDAPSLGELLRGQPGPTRSLNNPGALSIMPSNPFVFPDAASRIIHFFVLDDPPFVEFTSLAVANGVIQSLPSNDQGGLHWNSTVISHAFFLAIEGGRHQTSGVVVQGAGDANRAAVERAFFRALTELMPAATNLPLAALAIVQSAIDLFGETDPVTIAIAEALRAVELF